MFLWPPFMRSSEAAAAARSPPEGILYASRLSPWRASVRGRYEEQRAMPDTVVRCGPLINSGEEIFPQPDHSSKLYRKLRMGGAPKSLGNDHVGRKKDRRKPRG